MTIHYITDQLTGFALQEVLLISCKVLIGILLVLKSQKKNKFVGKKKKKRMHGRDRKSVV